MLPLGVFVPSMSDVLTPKPYYEQPYLYYSCRVHGLYQILPASFTNPKRLEFSKTWIGLALDYLHVHQTTFPYQN